MFFNKQNKSAQDSYKQYLQTVGYLSKLFSDSQTPYLYYRVAEKIFCQAFNAEDLSRSDVSSDAKKDNIGIGLKTFLVSNEKSFQKVAEFSKTSKLFSELGAEKLIRNVANLRNKRLLFTQNIYNLDKSIYHCVIRDIGKFKIFEENMDFIDIENIKNIKTKNNSIIFNDGINDYSFLLSKNTLTKRFITTHSIYEFPIEILKDPIEHLNDCFLGESLATDKTMGKETIYLPLYGKNRNVFEKSGLNQWNALGRKRDANEVYIPIPSKIHKLHPNFFPPRDKPFNIRLPNGKILQSKVCQDNSKALMSYSNKELGQWLLRDVLNIEEGKLVTYEILEEIGVDSVRIDKIDENLFEINFTAIGSYENHIKSIS